MNGMGTREIDGPPPTQTEFLRDWAPSAAPNSRAVAERHELRDRAGADWIMCFYFSPGSLNLCDLAFPAGSD